MKKIITINEGGFDNLGDHAIYLGLKQVINDLGLECDSFNFTRVSNIDDTQLHYSHQILGNKTILNNKRNFKSFLANFRFLLVIRWIQRNTIKILKIAKRKYDIAFIGGGQLILSGSMFPFAMLMWVCFLRLFGTQVYIVGAGAGNKFNRLEKLCYKLVFSMCDKVFLRDKESIGICSKFFGGVPIYFIPDLAYYMSTLNTTVKGIKILQVGVIDYDVYTMYVSEMERSLISKEDYVRMWVEEINLISENYDEINFSSTTYEDIYWSRRVYEGLKVKIPYKKLTFIENLENVATYIDSLKKVDTIISARMHSLILGQAFGSNVIPWEVSKKITSYKKEMLGGDVIIYKNCIRDVIQKIILAN